MRRGAIVLVVGLLGIIFATIVFNYSERAFLPSLAEAYVGLVPRELGAPNVITGILLTYRAFDTLGEVAVLFMVAASIGLLLGARDAERGEAPENDKAEATTSIEIVQNGADILVPLIAIFAAYIVMHGHLGPGGGFQGGAVTASCVLRPALGVGETRIPGQTRASQRHRVSGRPSDRACRHRRYRSRRRISRQQDPATRRIRRFLQRGCDSYPFSPARRQGGLRAQRDHRAVQSMRGR